MITTVSLVLNTTIGVAVWLSKLQLAKKIVITSVLLIKVILFFCSNWMSSGEAMTKWGISACIALNIVLLVYAVSMKEMLFAMTTAGAEVLLLIWAFCTVYDFRSK